MLWKVPHLLKVRRKLQTCPIIAHKPALCLMEVLLLRRQDATEKSFTFGEKKCNNSCFKTLLGAAGDPQMSNLQPPHPQPDQENKHTDTITQC